MFSPGPSELAVIGVLAIMLFGKNLPDVAKKLGRTYRDFRKGLSDMQAQINLDDDDTSTTSSSKSKYTSGYANDYDDYDAPVAPKFEPPTSEPEEN